MATETQKQRITLTYAGRREGVNGKLVFMYLHEGERHLYNKSLYAAQVGTVVSIDAVLDDKGQPTNVWPATARYESRTSGEMVAEWAAQDKAVMGAREAAKMAKAVDPFKEALAPLKTTYINSTGPQRAALVTAIIREVTSWV